MYKRDARRALFPCGELLVHLHEGGDAVGFGHLEGEAVGAHDGAVVGAVGLAKFLGHEDFVVEVGEAAVRVELPRVQDGLRGLFDGGRLLRRGRRPGKIIVDDVLGVALVAFQTTRNGSHPGHVNVGFQDAEMVKCSVRHEFDEIAAENRTIHKTEGNVASPLR